jgi:hypothetical protein
MKSKKYSSKHEICYSDGKIYPSMAKIWGLEANFHPPKATKWGLEKHYFFHPDPSYNRGERGSDYINSISTPQQGVHYGYK